MFGGKPPVPPIASHSLPLFMLHLNSPSCATFYSLSFIDYIQLYIYICILSNIYIYICSPAAGPGGDVFSPKALHLCSPAPCALAEGTGT